MGTVGRLFATIADRAHEKAKEGQDQQNKQRDMQVDLYKGIMADHASTPEQRAYAVGQLNKLMNIKGKDSPFDKVAGFLNHVGDKLQGKSQGGQDPAGQQGGQPGAGAQPTAPGQPAPGGGPPPGSVKTEPNPAQKNLAERALGKVSKGLGSLARMPGDILKPNLTPLPPLDASAFPTGDQERAAHAKDIESEADANFKAEQKNHVNQMKQYRDDLKQAIPGISDQQLDKATETKFGALGKMKLKEELVPDPNSSTGFSKKFVAEDTGEEISRTLDVAPPRSLVTSQSTTTDPYGLKTTTVRKPILGAPGSAPKGSGGAGGDSTPKAPPKATQDGAPAPSLPRLDGEGHIPSTKGLNPLVQESANELLDGRDLKDIQPSKVKSAAAELARKYGWEQGKFTPKEQVMLKEATTFLNEAQTSPLLKTLDEGFFKRLKMNQAATNPDKEGFIGRGLTQAAAQSLSRDEAQFIQMYNQLVGTISGLSQLVRSGRATEASIERLKRELPNPQTTKDSKDARERIARLLKEVKVAMDKGRFTDDSDKPAGKLPPLPPQGSGTKDDPIVIH
jgi:hypothetical protein